MKNMKYLSLSALVLMFGAVTVLPLTSLAATYYYVNTQGTVSSVDAPNATAALATAPNIAPNSGVALDEGIVQPTTSGTAVTSTTLHTYYYVNAAGFTAWVQAPDVATAFALATNRAVHSGVALNMGGHLTAGMKVASVK